MSLSVSEENYLKAIFKITEQQGTPVPTNAIAGELKTSAASVTDMLKKLAEKDLVAYKKYQGALLTNSGRQHATHLVRKHRLWEFFLVEKLNFSWDVVHDMAEQLEHIQSDELIERLDAFLEYPKFDPHGDPIPDASGRFTIRSQQPVSRMSVGEKAVVIGVQNHDSQFLKFLGELNLGLGCEIEVLDKYDFDASMKVRINMDETHLISNTITNNVYVKRN